LADIPLPGGHHSIKDINLRSQISNFN
jgi:hypothetical protein